MKRSLLLLLAVVLAGCQEEAPPPVRAVSPARAEIAAKLKAMSPSERTKYLREHAQEVGAAFPGMGMGGSHPAAPR